MVLVSCACSCVWTVSATANGQRNAGTAADFVDHTCTSSCAQVCARTLARGFPVNHLSLREDTPLVVETARHQAVRKDTFSCSLQQRPLIITYALSCYFMHTLLLYEDFLYSSDGSALLVQIFGRRRTTMRIMRHGRPAPPQSRLSDAALLAARSRAAELLVAATAHRTSVEHWLAKQQIKQQIIKQQQIKQQQQTAMADMKLTLSPEMIEAWMTAEDAVEVASWHMEAGQGDTCALASSAFEEGFAAAFSGLAEPPRASSEKPLMVTNWP